MKKIIVTGGLGFIGSNLIKLLIKKNLQDLGINHDNFISETQIVNDQE